MAEAIYLVGCGGHGRVLLDALRSGGVQVEGILDARLPPHGRVFDVSVLGGDEVLERVSPSAIRLVNGIGANPHTRHRLQVFDAMKSKGFAFRDVRHPSAVIGRECRLGEGSQIMAGVVLQPGVQIGPNAVINTRASVDHDSVVGAHAFVSPGAVLCGGVSVGDGAFVGAGATVVPGVRIGARAIVGAGAVVTKDVADGAVVAGNPAATIRTGTNVA